MNRPERILLGVISALTSAMMYPSSILELKETKRMRDTRTPASSFIQYRFFLPLSPLQTKPLLLLCGL